MTQLVPSDTTTAQAPEVAPKIAVPAAPPVIGTTLLDAESSAWAWVFLKFTVRPTQSEAAGSVTTQPEPVLLLMTLNSSAARSKLAVLVTGAPPGASVIVAGAFVTSIPGPGCRAKRSPC